MAYPRGAPKPAAGGGDTTTTVIELSRLGSKDPLCAAPKGDDSNVGGSGNSLGGDGDSDASLSIVQAGRQNPRLAGWTLALSTAIILTGFDINIISNVASLPEFQKQFGAPNPQFEPTAPSSLRFILPSLWLALWNAFVPLGAIAGSLLASPLADRLGRRPLMLIASTLSIAFVTVSYISDLADGPKNIDTRRAVFLLGKTGAGFGNGMLLVGVETWFSEVIPTKGPLRGAAMALFPVMTLVGQLLGAVVVQVALGAVPGSGDAGVDIEPTQYRACLAAQWPVAVAVLVVSFLMPESWVWLLGKGRIEAARRQWAKLQKSEEAPREAGISKWMLWQRRTSVSGAQQGSSLKDQTATLPSRPSAVTFEDIRLALEHEKHSNPHAAGRHSFYDLFRGSDRRRTLIVCLAMLVPIFFGLPLFATAGYFLQTIGMPAATSVIFIIIGVVLGLVSNVAAFWTLARFGRRRLLLSTLSVAAVGWLSVGIAGFFGGSDRPATVWYVAITLMAVLLVLGLGAWPASFAVGAETSSLVLRARTQGFAGATTNLATGAVSLALPYVYNPDQGNLGARVGLIFAVLCAIAVAAVWFLVPEMKNRSQRELDEMFELGLAARKFEHWRRPPQGHRITPPATANGAERMHQSDGLADDQRAQEHERLTQA